MTLGSQTVLHVSAQHSGERLEWDCSIQNVCPIYAARQISDQPLSAVLFPSLFDPARHEGVEKIGYYRLESRSLHAVYMVSSLWRLCSAAFVGLKRLSCQTTNLNQWIPNM